MADTVVINGRVITQGTAGETVVINGRIITFPDTAAPPSTSIPVIIKHLRNQGIT